MKRVGDEPLFSVGLLDLIGEFGPLLRKFKVTSAEMATVPGSQTLGFGRHVTTFGDALFSGKTQKFNSVQLRVHSHVLCHDQRMHGHVCFPFRPLTLRVATSTN